MSCLFMCWTLVGGFFYYLWREPEMLLLPAFSLNKTENARFPQNIQIFFCGFDTKLLPGLLNCIQNATSNRKMLETNLPAAKAEAVYTEYCFSPPTMSDMRWKQGSDANKRHTCKENNTKYDALWWFALSSLSCFYCTDVQTIVTEKSQGKWRW